MPSYDYDYGYSPTIRTKGGIKLQGKRDAENWWAKRWMEILDSFGLGGRLTRGRSYARAGQVQNIDVREGAVTARVQGSSPRPYKITLEINPLTEKQWDQVIEALSEQALYVATLLAGKMPEDIETIFATAKVGLLPQKESEIETDCSCPDASNPCKHIAAVFLLLGEEFDRDPFLIFKLRGMPRDTLLARLTERTTAAPESDTSSAAPPEPIVADPTVFWAGAAIPDTLLGEVRRPPVAAALPKRLGSFPFWRSDEPFLSTMEGVYTAASSHGLDLIMGKGRFQAVRPSRSND